MKPFSLAAAAALVGGLSAAAMVQAQPYYDGQGYSGDQDAQSPYTQPYAPNQPQSYTQSQQDYQLRQQQYRDAYSDYQNSRSDYDAQRSDYEERRTRYERERADYDDRYGSGAFDAYYRIHPDAYDARFGDGAYERDFGDPGTHHDWDGDR